jgi:hypothetical protein
MRCTLGYLTWAATVLIGARSLAGAEPPYLEWHRSAPTEGAVVDFRVATRSHWRFTVSSPVGVDRPDLRIEISNNSKTGYLFPAISAGWLTLERVDGKELKSFIRARGERRIEWLLVPPGETYAALCDVQVKCLADGKTRQMTYTSADGTMSTFEPMSPGKYKLHFRYELSNSQTIGEYATWAGKAVTGAVEFDITD